MFRVLLLVAVLLTTVPVMAATPSIESVAPGLGQRGTDFELKLVGAGFGNAEEVLFYRPGLICTKLQPVSENELTLQLKSSADCPLGSHPFRVRTRFGVTELRTFRVTPFPVVASQEPNNVPAEAQIVDRNVTIAGVAESNDYDCYRVLLKQGERLSAEIEAVRMGGPLLDMKLAVFGPDGTRLAEADDNPLFHQDPYLTLIAPTDGEYVVRVSETILEGDANSLYALHIGSFPRPAIVFPAGGPAGQTVEVLSLGDAAGDFVEHVPLPAGPVARFDYFPTQAGLAAPTPHVFRVSPFPNVVEHEPDADAAAALEPVSLPVAFNGILQSPGDIDHYQFHARAGEQWKFELYGDRIGSPIDAVITLTSETGEVLAACDDYDSHDGQIEFLVPQTGEYQLQVTDKREAGGPLFVYRIEATPARPALTAFMPRPNRRSQEQQTVSVPRGNRVLAYLAVQKVGVEGDVRLTPQGLPVGVAMSDTLIAGDRYWTPVIFSAAADAPVAGALAGINARGFFDGQPVEGEFRQVVDLISSGADELYFSTDVNRLAVAVTEEVPFQLHLQAPTTTLAQDGTLALRVEVKRQPGFDGAVDVTFPLLPPWTDGPAKLTIPGHETSGVYVVRARNQAEPRTWAICAEGRPGLAVSPDDGEDQGGGRRRSRGRSGGTRDIRVASELVSLEIAPPTVVAPLASVAGEQGQTVKLVYELEASGNLPDRLTATLEGLPNRVSAPAVEVAGTARLVEFLVQLEPTAPVGEFPSLVCRLTGALQGQDVSYCVGRGGVLTVVPPGELVTDEQGRPLSKLEALRRARRSAETQSPAANSAP